MKRFIWICLSFTVISSFGQEFTRKDADSMLSALSKSKLNIQRIDLLLSLAQFHILKPGENQVDFDSARSYINAAKNLNKTLKSSSAYGYQLLTESYLLKEKGKKEESRKLVEEAVTILGPGNNKYYLGRAYYELSMYYIWEDSQQLSQRIALVEKSIDAFKQAGQLGRNAYVLEMLGDLYSRQGEDAKAIQVLNQALAAYTSTKYQKLQGAYALLGELYMYRDERQALFYLLKALKHAQMLHDTTMQLCQINNILGTLYTRIDRRELSVKYLSDALEIARRHNDQDAVLLLATNLSTGYNNLNQPEQALKVLALLPEKYLHSEDPDDKATYAMAYVRTYTILKPYSNAQPYCDTLLKLAHSNSFGDQTKSVIYRLLAGYYLALKQYSKAQQYLSKNIALGMKMRSEAALVHSSRVQYKLDSARGNYRSAFNHLVFYKRKMDSIFSENRVKQLQVLGVEYETEMKEDSIKLKDKDISLLIQKNDLQEANLKRASLVKNVTIAGIFLAFLITGLLYREYRLKQKSNHRLQQQQQKINQQNLSLQTMVKEQNKLLTEKEWLLKEIHHRVKNNLQIVMSLLNSQSAFIDNQPALNAIHDSQHRVHAMSLIHQKLYSSESLSSIDMFVYIRELVTYLTDSFDTGQRIRFAFDVEPLELDVSQAVPLGLILNEAITNAIKYAFPGDRSGVIDIVLSKTTPVHYLLRISDNGIGMPSSINTNKVGSLGMSLMQGLSEDLDGSFSIESNNGTTVKILFMQDRSVRRHNASATSFATSN